MAYPIINGSIVEITFEGLLDGQQTMSLYHYKLTGTSGVTDGAAVLQLFIGQLREAGGLFPTYQDMCSDALTELQIYAQLVFPVRYRYTTDGQPSESGSVDSLAFPPNVQASITRAAEKSGRQYISHLSVPAIPILAIESGMMTAGFKEDMQAHCDQVVTPIVLIGGAEAQPVIWHRHAIPTDDPIVLAFPQNTSRVIRRRTVGLGS